MNKIRALFFVVCAAWLATAHGASVLPLYLDEMIDSSAIAFEGRCIANRTELDSATQLVVTYTTFEVTDALKGPVKATHEIKQIGGSLPGAQLEYRVQGVPTFEVGQEYVVFLAGVSRIGFSSPVGLGQGRFGVYAGGDGKGRRVTNGRDFRDMASRMVERLPAAAQAAVSGGKPVRDMELDEFKRAVRAHVEAKP